MINLYEILKIIAMIGLPIFLTAIVVSHTTHWKWINCAEQDFLMAYEGRLFKIVEIDPLRDPVDSDQPVHIEKSSWK